MTIEQRKLAEDKRDYVRELYGENPTMKPAEVQRAVKEKFNGGIDLNSIYRARKEAHNVIDAKATLALPQGFVRDIGLTVAPVRRVLQMYKIESLTIRPKGPVVMERVVSEEVSV